MYAEFTEEFRLSFNVKKSVCFVVEKEYGVGGLLDMCTSSQSIAWVNECCYLVVVIVAGKEFCSNVELRRRKFCRAANEILSICVYLTEKCIMHIINAQAVSTLAYGASVWKISYETRRRIGVCFNDFIRKIVGYFRYESVRQVLHEFGMLPMELDIVRSRLLLLGSYLQFNRQLVQ